MVWQKSYAAVYMRKPKYFFFLHEKSSVYIARFFYKQRVFSLQSQCCSTFSWIELKILLRFCLIHVTITMLRHILYLVYLCPCLGLSLFNFYPNDLFFILSLIFIVIYHITSLNRRNCFLYIFQNISYYFWMITWMKKANNFQIPKVMLDCFA